MVLEYQLGDGMKRRDGLYLSGLTESDISLDSMVVVRGMVYGPSTGSEYHFNLSFDPRLPGIAVFCDDTNRQGSAEYIAVLQRMSSLFQSEINPADGEGAFVKPQDKVALTAILKGVFDEFKAAEEHRDLVIDYKTR